MTFEDFYCGFTADSHQAFSVSPSEGKMERRNGPPTQVKVTVKPSGRTGEHNAAQGRSPSWTGYAGGRLRCQQRIPTENAGPQGRGGRRSLGYAALGGGLRASTSACNLGRCSTFAASQPVGTLRGRAHYTRAVSLCCFPHPSPSRSACCFLKCSRLVSLLPCRRAHRLSLLHPTGREVLLYLLQDHLQLALIRAAPA
eukprot:scaffold21237_cov121-Isochrysis_galbana.AAC.1